MVVLNSSHPPFLHSSHQLPYTAGSRHLGGLVGVTNICFWLQDVHTAWVLCFLIWHIKSKLQYPTQFHFIFELSLQGIFLTMIHSHKYVQSKWVTHKSTESGKPKRKVKSSQNCKRPSGKNHRTHLIHPHYFKDESPVCELGWNFRFKLGGWEISAQLIKCLPHRRDNRSSDP